MKLVLANANCLFLFCFYYPLNECGFGSDPGSNCYVIIIEGLTHSFNDYQELVKIEKENIQHIFVQNKHD